MEKKIVISLEGTEEIIEKLKEIKKLLDDINNTKIEVKLK